MVNRRISKGKNKNKKKQPLYLTPLEVFLVKEQGLKQVKFQVKIKTICVSQKQLCGEPLYK